MTGWLTAPAWPSKSFAAGRVRSSASDEAPRGDRVGHAVLLGLRRLGQFAASCKGSKTPPASVRSPCGTGPAAWGDASSKLTDMAPADCPAMVTFRGSPPKAAIFRWTHFRAAIWSIRP